MTKARIYSLDYLSSRLKEEKDPRKREQMRLLLEEMSEVYPEESELIDDPYELFTTPKQWQSRKLRRKLVIGTKGVSFSGKSYEMLSASHLTRKHIENDFKALKSKERDEFCDWLEDNFLPFTPLWVIGTEESTLEILRSFDNEEYFEHADINYVEVLKKGKGMTILDHMATYKNFLIALYSLSNLDRGTIMLDSTSGVLAAQHEIVRKIIGKIPSLKKEQGILPRHWFWRNVEREGMMFYGRIVNAHFMFTAKTIVSSREDGEDYVKVRWYEEADRHLSSIIFNNDRISETEAKFRTTVEKCRIDSSLYGKSYQNLTMPIFMYNLYLTYKQRKLQKLKEENKDDNNKKE